MTIYRQLRTHNHLAYILEPTSKLLNMKKIITLMMVAASLCTIAGHSQISLSLNIGTQPAWGPTGYDHVDYYYLPDMDAYYDVPNQVYYFKNGNSWTRTSSLPARYRNFDLYHSHKVVINNVNRPYLQNDKYRRQYAGFKGKHDQVVIRDSKEEKYFVNKDHPQHAQWQKSHGQDNRNQGRDDNRGKDRKDNNDSRH